MIIGKSLTALGGGGLKPEIIVTAKAGALLNLHYKGSSIILQSYQLGESETQHTFVVSVSETAYVVDDATNNASVEVLVDSVAQYSAEIKYILWLYDGSDNGNEFTDVTGGWIGVAGTHMSYFETNNSYDCSGMNYLGVRCKAIIGDSSLLERAFINVFGSDGTDTLYFDMSGIEKNYVYPTSESTRKKVRIAVTESNSSIYQTVKNNDYLYIHQYYGWYNNKYYNYEIYVYKVCFGGTEDDVILALNS